MKTVQLATLTREVALAIGRRTALPSLRREFERTCVTSRLEGFHQLERPCKDESDQTRRIDAWAESLFLTDPRLSSAFPEFVAVSEERGVLYYPTAFRPRPGHSFTLLMLDPVDNTDLVVRRFGGAVTALAAEVRLCSQGRMEQARLVSAAVADVAGGEVFYTGRELDVSRVQSEAGEENLEGPPAESADLSLSAILVKLKRFQVLAPRFSEVGQKLESPVRFILHHGGPLPLCRVAAGDLDLAFDLLLGYKAMDYAPGLWIAARAGCRWTVLDQQGRPIPGFDPSELRIPQGENLETQLMGYLEQRTRFAVASSSRLLELACQQFLVVD